MDAGSGAKHPIPAHYDRQLFGQHTNQPIVVGGGIRTTEGIHAAWNAGADVVVIGNRLEEDPGFLQTLLYQLSSGIINSEYFVRL